MSINGLLNLYKNSGITSNKALSILKRILKENNISTKVGHFGTLDPLAEGVLPIALGRATRIFEYTLDKVKRYTAIFKFGINTDTLDIEGKVDFENGRLPTYSEIEKVLPKLVGEVEQMPPAFSAKSVNGVRAYKLARQGIEVLLKPKKINIFSIELIEQIDEATYKFDISCSGGTYIRSIVRDMAKLLDTYGVMTNLIRTQSGSFEINNSVKIDEIKENIQDYIIPMDKVLDYMPKYFVPDEYRKPVQNGVAISLDNLPSSDFSVYFDDKLIGIAQKDANNNMKIKTWLL
jgi:tRNA pseudouridine55 synthase